MNILFITKNIVHYKAAMYQNEFLQELQRQENVVIYGPGEEVFDSYLDINQVISKLNFNPDWILVGHAWLSDKESGKLDEYPDLKLEKTMIPKAIMLNKEYVRLKEKLDWIKFNNFQCGFSHHHDVDYYSVRSNTPFHFLPFAFDEAKVITIPNQEKLFSLSFSGILQNQNKSAKQSDIRLRVMNSIFITIFDIPLFKRNKYRHLSIFWNSIPRNRYIARLAKLIGKYKRMSDSDYYAMQKKSIIFFNSPSPLEIISPRIFENMACKAIPLCQKSDVIIEGCHVVTYKDDLSDFDEKLKYCLSGKKEINDMIEKNYENAFQNHTWNVRVKSLIKILKNN